MVETTVVEKCSTKQQWLNLMGSWMSWLFDAMDAGLFALLLHF